MTEVKLVIKFKGELGENLAVDSDLQYSVLKRVEKQSLIGFTK